MMISAICVDTDWNIHKILNFWIVVFATFVFSVHQFVNQKTFCLQVAKVTEVDIDNAREPNP